MAIFKKPPGEEPKPEPEPRPGWPASIKCHVCSLSLDRNAPGVKWARRHCRMDCGWYACVCGGFMWIDWSQELEAWVTKRSVRLR